MNRQEKQRLDDHITRGPPDDDDYDYDALIQDLKNAGCKMLGDSVEDTPTAREILAEWDVIPLDTFRLGSPWYLTFVPK